MIIKAHHHFYKRIMPFIEGTTLMLGNQEVQNGYQSPFPRYTTLDPDGGDWRADLSSLEQFPQYQTIVNIGTTEHIWDVHSCYCNIARLTFDGGHYISTSPCAGYAGHGVHVTNPELVRKFFEYNGFVIIDEWFTDRSEYVDERTRHDYKKDTLHWFVARKDYTVRDFIKPQQVFQNMRKI